MNKEAFVNAVQLAVEDGAVTSTIQLLSHLPGRKPDERLLALSGGRVPGRGVGAVGK
jgi:hypothetical protein